MHSKIMANLSRNDAKSQPKMEENPLKTRAKNRRQTFMNKLCQKVAKMEPMWEPGSENNYILGVLFSLWGASRQPEGPQSVKSYGGPTEVPRKHGGGLDREPPDTKINPNSSKKEPKWSRKA